MSAILRATARAAQKESPPNRVNGSGADGDASRKAQSVNDPNQSPARVNARLTDSLHSDDVDDWMTRRTSHLVARDDGAATFDSLYDGIEPETVVDELEALYERLGRAIPDRGPVNLAAVTDALAAARSTIRLACIALRTTNTREVLLGRASAEAHAELALLLKANDVALPDPKGGVR